MTPRNSVINVRAFSTTHFMLQDQNINAEPVITSNESNVPLVSKPSELPNPEKSAVSNPGNLDTNAEINNMSSNVHTSSHSTPLNESEILKTESAVSEENKELVLDFLPDRPVPVESSTSIDFLGVDPPLESLGLASWWPPGRMQYFMEMLHSGTGLDLSWLQTIVISKLI